MHVEEFFAWGVLIIVFLVVFGPVIAWTIAIILLWTAAALYLIFISWWWKPEEVFIHF